MGGHLLIQQSDNGDLNIENASMRQLIAIAWNVTPAQIEGGTASGTYDVIAKRGSLQTLLKDRFKLAPHRKTKDMPVYYLTSMAGAPKLTSINHAETIEVRRGHIDASRVRMRDLTNILSGILDRPVIDKTGITVAFDVHLEFLPDDAIDATGPDASLFNVLEEKLRLKLESGRASVEIFALN